MHLQVLPLQQFDWTPTFVWWKWILKDHTAHYIASTTLWGGSNYIGTLEMNTHLHNITLCDQNLPKLPKPILSKSVTLALCPTSTQQFRQGRIRELALSCGILDLKNMQRDKLTSDPKYFETCLTSLYSYITYHTDKHKPFTIPTLEQIHLSCHKYQRQHLKHKQRSDNPRWGEVWETKVPLTRLTSTCQDKTLQTRPTRSRVNKQVPLLLPRS